MGRVEKGRERRSKKESRKGEGIEGARERE
jgi:hypothetical protein